MLLFIPTEACPPLPVGADLSPPASSPHPSVPPRGCAYAHFQRMKAAAAAVPHSHR